MVSIWGTFWLLQHAMFPRPGCNLARLWVPSGPIQGAKAIACRSTTNGFIGKRMRPYCNLEIEQLRCILVKQSLFFFSEKACDFPNVSHMELCIRQPSFQICMQPANISIPSKVIGHEYLHYVLCFKIIIESIWGTFWLLQHAMFVRLGCNLARLCSPSGPIQGAKVIACRSTTNGFMGKRMKPYCKLETEQVRCILVRQSLWMFL